MFVAPEVIVSAPSVPSPQKVTFNQDGSILLPEVQRTNLLATAVTLVSALSSNLFETEGAVPLCPARAMYLLSVEFRTTGVLPVSAVLILTLPPTLGVASAIVPEAKVTNEEPL